MNHQQASPHAKNFQFSERLYYLLFLGGLGALAPLSIDTYMPTIPAIAKEFSSPIALVNLTMSVFMFGMGIGQLFGGPLSDQFGRKKIGMVGLSVYVIFSLFICFATSIQQVLALRAFQALGAGFASVICLAQIRDVYPPSEASKKVANVMLIMLIAPMVAPMLGAVLSQYGWRTVFYLLAAIGIGLLTSYIFWIPETLSNNKRSVRSFTSVIDSYYSVITHRRQNKRLALWYSLFHGASFGIFVSYLTSIAHISMSVYALSKFAFASLFAVNAVFLILGNRIGRALLDKASPIKLVRKANLVQIFILLALAMTSSFYELPFTIFCIGIAALMVCQAILNPSISGAYIALFDRDAGTASAWLSTVQLCLGAFVGSLAAIASMIFEVEFIASVFYVMLFSAVLGRLFLFLSRPSDSDISSS